MNSKLLAFLEEIKTQGNMSKAAQTLFVTQPYISRVIKNAENHFGVHLIDRSSHPIRLTYAGERLLSYLQEQNRLRVTLDREMTHLSEYKYGHLSIASDDSLSDDAYSKIITKFNKKYPNIHLQIINTTARDAEKRVLSGSLDFFIGKKINNPKLTHVSLVNTALALVIQKSMASFDADKLWIDYDPNILNELIGHSFISIPHDSSYQRMINSFLNEINLPVEFNFEVPTIQLAVKLALNNLGAVIAPKYIIKRNQFEDAEVSLMKLPKDQLATKIELSYLENTKNSKPINELIEIIKDVLD